MEEGKYAYVGERMGQGRNYKSLSRAPQTYRTALYFKIYDQIFKMKSLN